VEEIARKLHSIAYPADLLRYLFSMHQAPLGPVKWQELIRRMDHEEIGIRAKAAEEALRLRHRIFDHLAKAPAEGVSAELAARLESIRQTHRPHLRKIRVQELDRNIPFLVFQFTRRDPETRKNLLSYARSILPTLRFDDAGELRVQWKTHSDELAWDPSGRKYVRR
jgi:hypothetical protein